MKDLKQFLCENPDVVKKALADAETGRKALVKSGRYGTQTEIPITTRPQQLPDINLSLGNEEKSMGEARPMSMAERLSMSLDLHKAFGSDKSDELKRLYEAKLDYKEKASTLSGEALDKLFAETVDKLASEGLSIRHICLAVWTGEYVDFHGSNRAVVALFDKVESLLTKGSTSKATASKKENTKASCSSKGGKALSSLLTESNKTTFHKLV